MVRARRRAQDVGHAEPEAARGVAVVHRTPHLEAEAAAQGFEVVIRNDIELLVRGRVNKWPVAQLLHKDMAEAHGQGHGKDLCRDMLYRQIQL